MEKRNINATEFNTMLLNFGEQVEESEPDLRHTTVSLDRALRMAGGFGKSRVKSNIIREVSSFHNVLLHDLFHMRRLLRV